MNIKEQLLSFFPLEEKHRDIILGWIKKEHVKEFYYGEGLENTLRNLDLFIQGIKNNGEYSFEHWMMKLDIRDLILNFKANKNYT